jgi:hypothetical protein
MSCLISCMSAATQPCLPQCLEVRRNIRLFTASLGCLPHHRLVQGKVFLSTAMAGCLPESPDTCRDICLFSRDVPLSAATSGYLVFRRVICFLDGVAHRNLEGRGRDRRSFVAALACSPQSEKRSPWIAVLHLGSGRSVE